MNIRHFELVSEADVFLKENFNLQLTVPIEFESRIKKVLGRCIFNKINKEYIPEKIQISVDLVKNYPKEIIIDVLRHELVHYAMCIQKRPFFDGDREFENELNKLGIKSTRSYKIMGDVHNYHCSLCGNKFTRKRKLSKFAKCSCSLNSVLIYDGISTIKDMSKIS